jgi:hypothetical protein
MLKKYTTKSISLSANDNKFMEGLFPTMGKAHSSLTSNQRMLASVKVSSLSPQPVFKNKFSTQNKLWISSI